MHPAMRLAMGVLWGVLKVREIVEETEFWLFIAYGRSGFCVVTGCRLI